jgi:tRNA-Thr(GGU) m(6)t(6)A37 methyltransferase TsaA
MTAPPAGPAGDDLVLRPIGRVRSSLADPALAPRQADEGAPTAWIDLDPAVVDGLRGVRAGDDVVVLTWLDRARRDVLVVHPRSDPDRPPTGVFATRSPERPNPVGLHPARVVAVEGTHVQVDGLEAIDGTPVLDIKPTLGDVDTR